jgi:DNA primase
MADPVVDEIKARIDIVDLVSQTVQLKKAGRFLKGLCPFHGEKTPSFYVYPDQGSYHCYGCGKGGDAFTWLQETDHLSFGEALRLLAERAGVRLPERSERKPDPEAQASADALTQAAAWYHEQLLRSPEAEAARQYLHRRGLKPDTVRRFEIGWAPASWEALVNHLRAKGISGNQLVEAGLAREGERGLRDYFRGRITFPIRDPEGKVCGFGARTLGDEQPKYLNSPQSPFFDKSATLYGLDLARQSIRKDGVAVIVEGYMDTVVPHQEGFTNVVASLGTALTDQQLALLKRYTATIVLALDSDAAGQAATLRGLEVARLSLREARRPVPGRVSRTGFLQASAVQIKIATVTGGKDPDEIVREDPASWRKALDEAVPMMDHKLNVELQRVDPRDPHSKTAAIQELARFLVQVPDPIEWSHYVDIIAQRLRVDMHAVKGEVDRAARAVRQEERRAIERHRPEPAGESGPVDDEPAQRHGNTSTNRSETRPLTTATTFASAGTDDVTEAHFVSLLVSSPSLVRQLPSRPAPEELHRPEYRELYRSVLAYQAAAKSDLGGTTALTQTVPQWPGAGGIAFRSPMDQAPVALPDRAGELVTSDVDAFRATLDPSLYPTYDDLRAMARRRPPQTPSQLDADLVKVTRRLRESTLRQQLLHAQYLLNESSAGAERRALQQQVARLTAMLLRVQLEQSRGSLYSSPPT